MKFIGDMKNILKLAAAFSAVVLAGCDKPEDLNGGNTGKPSDDGHSFVGLVSESFKTRTAVDGVGTISWTENDNIELYAEKMTYPYVLTEDGRTFSSDVTPEGTVLYAAYPAEYAIWSAAGLTIKLPAERLASDECQIPLVAEIGKTAAEIEDISFKIPVGLITLTCDVPVGYTSLVATSTGKKISGTFLYKDGQLAANDAAAPNSVVFGFDSPETKTSMTFNLPVPAAEYGSINFKLMGEGGKELQITEISPLNVERGGKYVYEVKGDLTIAFGDIPEGDLVFEYEGGTRDYPVYSDVDWKPVSGHPDIIVAKKDNRTVSVTMPAGRYLGGLSSEIKVMAADPGTILAPAVMTVSQKNNPGFTVQDGSDITYDEHGYATFRVSPDIAKSQLTASGKGRYGTYTIEIADADMKVGILNLSGWGEGVNLQCQIGLYNRIYFSDTKLGDKDNKFYFDKSYSYAEISAFRKIELKLFPVAKEGSETEKVMNIQLYFDGNLVLDKKTKDETFADENRGGFSFSFGLETRTGDQPDTVPSFVTIKSYTYTTEY